MSSDVKKQLDYMMIFCFHLVCFTFSISYTVLSFHLVIIFQYLSFFVVLFQVFIRYRRKDSVCGMCVRIVCKI